MRRMSVVTMLLWSKGDQTRLFQNTLDEGTEPWGVMVERVEVITIMLIKITSFSLRYFFVLSKLLIAIWFLKSRSPGEGREGARPADEGDGGRGRGRQGGQSQGDQHPCDGEKCYADNGCLDAYVNYWGGQSQGDQQHRGMLTLLIDANNIMMTTPIYSMMHCKIEDQDSGINISLYCMGSKETWYAKSASAKT